MSANMPPPSPPMPPSPPSSDGGGYGPLSEEDIQQMMADTGFSREQVCQAIDRTGATTKEQVFPQLYSGAGIEPPQPQGETVGPGAVQGDPTQQGQPPSQPMATSPNAVPPPPDAGMPSQGGAPMQAQPQADGIDPAIAEKMHALLAPKNRR